MLSKEAFTSQIQLYLSVKRHNVLLLTTALKIIIPDPSVMAFDSRVHRRSVPIPVLHLSNESRGKAMVTLQLLSEELNSYIERNLNELLKCSVDFLLKSLSCQAAILPLQVTDKDKIEIFSTSPAPTGCLTPQTMRFIVNAEICCVGTQPILLSGKIDTSENQ